MNEEVAGVVVHAAQVSALQTQASLMMLGGQIMSAILIGAGIIAAAILAHAIIHGLMVRNSRKTRAE